MGIDVNGVQIVDTGNKIIVTYKLWTANPKDVFVNGEIMHYYTSRMHHQGYLALPLSIKSRK